MQLRHNSSLSCKMKVACDFSVCSKQLVKNLKKRFGPADLLLGSYAKAVLSEACQLELWLLPFLHALTLPKCIACSVSLL